MQGVTKSLKSLKSDRPGSELAYFEPTRSIGISTPVTPPPHPGLKMVAGEVTVVVEEEVTVVVVEKGTGNEVVLE